MWLEQGIVLDRSHVRDTNRRDVLVANSCDAAFGSGEEQMKELKVCELHTIAHSVDLFCELRVVNMLAQSILHSSFFFSIVAICFDR